MKNGGRWKSDWSEKEKERQSQHNCPPSPISVLLLPLAHVPCPLPPPARPTLTSTHIEFILFTIGEYCMRRSNISGRAYQGGKPMPIIWLGWPRDRPGYRRQAGSVQPCEMNSSFSYTQQEELHVASAEVERGGWHGREVSDTLTLSR